MHTLLHEIIKVNCKSVSKTYAISNIKFSFRLKFII